MSDNIQQPDNQEPLAVHTQPEPQPAPQPEPQAAAVQGAIPDDDLNLAMLSHFGAILLGFIPPMIIWLMNKDKADKAFVNDQAKEALNFQITVAIGFFICFILAFVLIGGLLALILWLADIVLCILAGLAAKRGETYRYPFTLRLLK